jgi:ubiquinone/menaquinone biosynthesis C-methylase UbiE
MLQSYKDVYSSYKHKAKKRLIKLNFLKKFIEKNSNIYIDKKTGVLHSHLNRTPKYIADYWGKIFKKNKKSTGKIYDSSQPFAISRLTYVFLTALNFIKKNNVKVKICDFATGEGNFLKIASIYLKNKQISATESSFDLYKLLKKKYEIHNLTLGSNLIQNKIKNFKQPNFGFLSWTLCNCIDPIEVLKDVHRLLDNNNGYLCVAESSRILVPFKKKVNEYFNKKIIQDAHPFHFSKKSLTNLLLISGFKPVFYNRYEDSDILLIIAKKVDKIQKSKYACDDPKNVLKFMKEWNKFSKMLTAIQ